MKIPARFRVLCKTDRGGSLVELALAVPILMMLLAGAIDFGFLWFEGLEVTNAAHAGAEYGSQYPTDTAGMATAAHHSAANLSGWATPTATYGCECGDGTLYSANCSVKPTTCTPVTNVVYRVQVTAQSVYNTLAPWPSFMPSSITITRTATMRAYHP